MNRMSSFQDRFEGVWTPLYIKKLLFKIAMVFLIIGGLNWLLVGLFDLNLVTSLFGKGFVSDLIFVLVGISALSIMLDRDTYLPFLGPMVAPCSVLQNKEPPGATKDVKVVVTPNTKVIYWAAEPANEKLKSLQSWKDAYLEYENAGVATSNGEGVAVLKVRDPQPYKVPLKGKLESHVHYRVCNEAGWMGRINTVFLHSNGPEGFEDNVTDKNYRGKNLADSAASQY
jgi:uncharacterized membrane protein YuzA (DUF378 family)